MNIIADPELEGKSVKEILFSILGFSNNAVKALKSDPFGICVDGNRVTVRHIMQAGEVLSLAIGDCEHRVSENVVARALPLSVIYENENYIVLNKPAGMPTHPSHNHHDDSLANALAYLYETRQEPFVFRAVNRLDLDTSGIVLFAKSKFSAAKLARVRLEGGFVKEYLALLKGELCGDGKVEFPIRRHSESTMLRVTCALSEPGAKSALTSYRVLRISDGVTLVSASPITGRTHQLRVHFAAIGHPILGDGLYGNADDFARLALHAYRLSFNDPFDGRHKEFIAEKTLPYIEIFDKYIKNLRKDNS